MGKIVNITPQGFVYSSSNLRASTNYLVETPSKIQYRIFVEAASGDVFYKKSTNNGVDWNPPVLVSSAIGCNCLTVWYDRWSGIDAGLIHCAYIDDTADIALYRNINTESSDTLSTQYTIWDFTSSAAGGTFSITRTRGGNLICGCCVDAGAEFFSKKSTDVGATWTDITALGEAATDQCILLPGWAADNQDAMAFFWDASAEEISRKLYDDSANSWAETSIATSMTDVVAATSYPHWAAAVDITNSQNILVAWSAVDSANADLRCWKVTESAITEVTNVVLNSTDDQGMCAIGIDINTNYWYVFYGGKSDGSETWNTAVNVYYKVSQNSGSTWGAETKISNSTMNLKTLCTSMRFYDKFQALANSIRNYGGVDNYVDYILKEINVPNPTYQLGM